MPPIKVPDSPEAMRAFVANMIVPQLQAMTDDAFMDVYLLVAGTMSQEITRRNILPLITGRLQAQIDGAHGG